MQLSQPFQSHENFVSQLAWIAAVAAVGSSGGSKRLRNE
jgi:hypothetical protein